MKGYQTAGLHHAQFFLRWGSWNGVEGMMSRAREHETRTTWDRLTQQILTEWVAQ